MRTLPCLTLLALCALGSPACGGATSGPGASSTVSGQAGGAPVPTTDTVAIVQTQATAGPNGAGSTTVEIAILNIANTCSILQRHGEPPNTRVLGLTVTAQGASVPPGAYTVGVAGNGQALASFATTDAKCAPLVDERATSGTITLTSITSSLVKGSFDVTLSSATGTGTSSSDHLTGTFEAPICDYTPSTATPVCGS